MASRVDARDVLDTNAVTKRAFRARVVGYWRQIGPDSWDPFEYVPFDGGEIDVRPGLKVQTEEWRPELRIRRGGRVERVAWAPDADERRRIEREWDGDERAAFLGECVSSFDEAPGAGAGSVIARKLRG